LDNLAKIFCEQLNAKKPEFAKENGGLEIDVHKGILILEQSSMEHQVVAKLVSIPTQSSLSTKSSNYFS